MFQLAEQLHMPVSELMQKVSRIELQAWAKYYERKAQLAKRKH